MNIAPPQLLRLIVEKRSLRKRLANALWENRQLARKLRVAEQSYQQQDRTISSLRVEIASLRISLAQARAQPLPEWARKIQATMNSWTGEL